MDWATLSTTAVMVAVVFIAVITDVRSGKIYNSVTLPAAIIGLILNGVFHGLDGIGASLLGLAAGFGVVLFSSLFGRILGGGGIKLLMAVGALQGPEFLLWTVIYTAIAGGIMAIAITLWRKDFLASMRRLWAGLTMRLFARVPIDVSDGTPVTARLPYAIPIAAGSLVAFCALHLLPM